MPKRVQSGWLPITLPASWFSSQLLRAKRGRVLYDRPPGLSNPSEARKGKPLFASPALPDRLPEKLGSPRQERKLKWGSFIFRGDIYDLLRCKRNGRVLSDSPRQHIE